MDSERIRLRALHETQGTQNRVHTFLSQSDTLTVFKTPYCTHFISCSAQTPRLAIDP